jgi:uncharacterized protein YjbI with pentapeptide repeats
MSEKLRFENKDVAGSEFRHVNMSGTTFEDVDLSRATFFNVNLRGADIGAVDFGGARFSCMNTGEDHPRLPVIFKNIELDDCTMQDCCFKNAKVVNCDLTGMTIDGVLVSEMVKAVKGSTPKL